MIDHLSLGISELARSTRFYDRTLGALGYQRLSADDSSLSYGSDEPKLWLLKTSRPVIAEAIPGLHLSFVASTPAQVDAFYRAALDYGGSDNGGPGVRESYGPGYYAAFVVDPDGYRLEAHCEMAEAAK